MRPGKLTACLCLAAIAGASALATMDARTPAEGIQRALAALKHDEPREAARIAEAVAGSGRAGCERAWLIVGAAHQRIGAYQPAAEAYRRFLTVCTSPTERRYVSGQIDRCTARAARAARPRPAARQLSAQQRLRLADVGGRHSRKIESTDHFVIHAHNAELAKLTGRQAEAALEHICGALLHGQDFAHTVEIHVWPTVAEYRRHASRTAPEWAGGAFTLKRSDDGAVTRRIDLTQLNDERRFDVNMLDRVLPHEICHLVLAEYFGDAHCPLSVNEGLAMMAEATHHHDRIRLAAAALAGDRRIPLRRLLAADRVQADHAAVFYAESYSLVSFLHARLTARQFRDLLANLKDGCPFGDALQRALYLPHDGDYLVTLADAWQADAIRQGQFLKALDTDLSAAR